MKLNKITYFSYVVAGAAFFVGSAEGFYPYRSGELFVKAEPQLQYDSNVYANSSEEEDWVLRVPVGLLLIQDAGHIRAEADAGVEFGFFERLDDEDYSDPFARVNFTYDREGHPLWSEARLGWWRETRADPTIGTGVERQRPEVERADVRLRSRYRLSPRLGLRGGVDYGTWEYNRGDLSDRDRYGFEVGGEYSYSPRLDVGLNYGYDRSELNRAGAVNDIASDDHSAFISLRGEISPRVTQMIEVGATRRVFDADRLPTRTEPYAAVSLLWQVDEPTEVRLTGFSDFSFSAESASISEKRAELAISRRIDPKITVGVNAFYMNQDFEFPNGNDRTDDVLGGGARLSYQFTRLVSARADASYEKRSSTEDFADYDRILVSGTLLFRY